MLKRLSCKNFKLISIVPMWESNLKGNSLASFEIGNENSLFHFQKGDLLSTEFPFQSHLEMTAFSK